MIEHTYGLTSAQFEKLLEAQGHRCGICGRRAPRLVAKNGKVRHALTVDHDHITGAVRGLLCNACNAALGCFQDDVRLIAEAMKYLAVHDRASLEGLHDGQN
ncbi:MAG TPA: endonuclease VII domain-containing protein [Thermoanaerobaculia bacterium]|jgi:hypothetical protein